MCVTVSVGPVACPYEVAALADAAGAGAAVAAAAVLPLPGLGFTSSIPAVLSRKAYSKAVSLRRSNLQRQQH